MINFYTFFFQVFTFNFTLLTKKIHNIKQFLLAAAVCVAGFMSAEVNNSFPFINHVVNVKMQDTRSINLSSGAVRTYSYLYQSTCGVYFSMTSTILVTDMSYEQYNEFMSKVMQANDDICSNYTPGPTTFYAKKNLNIKDDSISIFID